MSVMEDLISFDIIETQKENIQSLPQGRSAKALAAQFGPTPFSPAPTLGATRTLNDAIRQEYEVELQGIADADDPLDIYDRYVKWTMNAYPSAQATPESQLRPLLERATKTFQGSAQYKNDVRYLKMWLNYVRFFSDSPREVYAYLSRHGIGEGLALYYEEFAAWLESAGRWSQADEVYRLGVDKEARPAERLLRKYGEFQRRFEARPADADEPTSPALPTVRPALAAKLDPFASSTPSDPQSRRGLGSTTSKSGRTKMAIFSDADDSGSGSRPGTGDTSRGWDSIGTISDRKKENAVEARPWVGETMRVGKKPTGPKMTVFKDEPTNASRSVLISTKNGKTEKWFADILSVCPNEQDSRDEFCFEELRARYRGWLGHEWTRTPIAKSRTKRTASKKSSAQALTDNATMEDVSESTRSLSLGEDITSSDLTLGMQKPKPRKKKVMEVRAETQTIKAVLDSPVKKTKVKRKKSSEPTMTLYTKAATDDVLDLFNQPLRNIGPIGSRQESDGDATDYEPDDYTCGVSSVGDVTRTGNLSDTGSVYDDETGHQSETTPAESTQPDSVSAWSDFSTSRHVPVVDQEQIDAEASVERDEQEELETPVEPKSSDPFTQYVSAPPEEFSVPKGPFRTAEQVAQSKLPFMTPIVEMTEYSMGLPTVRAEKENLYAKTPSRRRGDVTETIMKVASPSEKAGTQTHLVGDKDALGDTPDTTMTNVSLGFLEPVVCDARLNPHDLPVRKTIMEAARLEERPAYYDFRNVESKKSGEIRRYVKSLQKPSKGTGDKIANVAPCFRFPGQDDIVYTIKRELGKGAYAPVYLATATKLQEVEAAGDLIAIKAEDPPSAWEFYILSTLHERLSVISPWSLESITKLHGFHHFSDEVYLVESYHDQGTLLDLVNLARTDPAFSAPANGSSGSSGLDEVVCMFFAVELLRCMGAMHEAGVIHGDLKADNCLVRLDTAATWASQYDPSGDDGWSQKGLTLIDFGRGIDMTAFAQDVGFIADWKTSKDDCVEMRELRPWTHQVDYWGAAGVLHVLLFGKWIEDTVSSRDRDSLENQDGQAVSEEKTMMVGKAGLQRRKLKEGLKRYWQTELWTDVFDFLMNPTAWADEDHGILPARQRLHEVVAALESWLAQNSEKRGLKAQLRRIEDKLKERRRRD